jgi:hypothetical protein
MMTTLSVDPGRLGQEAGTLGVQVSAMNQARDEVTQGTAAARGSCGSVSDDGLHGALQHLSDAWGYEIAAIGSDLGSLAGLMKGLAQAYAQQDSQGVTQINGG